MQSSAKITGSYVSVVNITNQCQANQILLIVAIKQSMEVSMHGGLSDQLLYMGIICIRIVISDHA